MVMVSYYLVGGEHFVVRKDGAGYSLWHHGALKKEGISKKAAALKQMAALIRANLDDRALMAMQAVSDLQAARARLQTGGLSGFQILEAQS